MIFEFISNLSSVISLITVTLAKLLFKQFILLWFLNLIWYLCLILSQVVMRLLLIYSYLNYCYYLYSCFRILNLMYYLIYKDCSTFHQFFLLPYKDYMFAFCFSLFWLLLFHLHFRFHYFTFFLHLYLTDQEISSFQPVLLQFTQLDF